MTTKAGRFWGAIDELPRHRRWQPPHCDISMCDVGDKTSSAIISITMTWIAQSNQTRPLSSSHFSHTPKAATQQGREVLKTLSVLPMSSCEAQGLTWAMAWSVAEAPYFSASLSTCPICALEITCTKHATGEQTWFGPGSLTAGALL